MEFEWDDEKAASNLRKHGVAFADAIGVFDDHHAMTDPAKSVDEERRKTTGYADEYALVTVIHTTREMGGVTFVRLISARPASRRERREYGNRPSPA